MAKTWTGFAVLDFTVIIYYFSLLSERFTGKAEARMALGHLKLATPFSTA
jgi:hypothetical protein